MFEHLNWRDKKELGQLSKEVKAELQKRGDHAPRFKTDLAAVVAAEIGFTKSAVAKNPLDCYRRAIESMKEARSGETTPGNLVNRFGTGQLNFARHYGLVSKRLVGMPRQISVGGW